FGGWLMPVLLVQVVRAFPVVKAQMGIVHLRNISILLLLSAFGMLLSFPFMGYAVTSIIFSTLSVAASFYLIIMVWKGLSGRKLAVSEKFLKAGLVYLGLSAIGPFATGPLIAMGEQGSPLYFNAIYFYLHFQINGWFVFVIMALLYRLMEKDNAAGNGDKVFLLFNLACAPSYFLSVLWNQPAAIFYWIGGAAAMVQLAGLYYLAGDWKAWRPAKGFPWMNIVMFAFVLKCVLQFLSAFPVFASMAYENKSLVIAYLHLVLLGVVSLFVMASIQQQTRNNLFLNGIHLFMISFVLTESLLVLFALGSIFHFSIPYYQELLLACSVFFPIGIGCMISAFQKDSATQGFRILHVQPTKLYSIATRLH
ncbi:MAG: hypothetical protein ACXWC7_19405, partial [Chitinophagaceae bacterium]